MLGKTKISDSSVGSYQSDKVYKKPIPSQIGDISINYEGIGRNPVIVIHGFLGSHLKRKKR